MSHVNNACDLCECACGRRYACKTIPKMPKRGKATPRYLLKLQQEVDAMQQIGASFDAVYLRVSSMHNALIQPDVHTVAVFAVKRKLQCCWLQQ